jgi:hypothetical protein
MKAIHKKKFYIKAALVIAVALAFVIPTSAVVTNPLSVKTYQSTGCSAKQTAIHKSLPVVAQLGTDVLISSDNPDLTDETPKTTMSNDGTIVVTYEKEGGALARVIPLVYSKDNGQTWIEQFEFDSINMQEGSGYLQSPDIKYSAAAGQFFWHAIDPFATSYNEEYYWIPGDIENATVANGWGVSGTGSTDYMDGAIANVGEWALGLAIDTSYGIINAPGLGDWWWDGTTALNPVDVDPSWAAGFYYDGGSILKTAQASQPEMATGNHVYMVMQSFNGAYSNISFKATVTDLNPSSPTFLFTSGGGPGGMDKYTDIEVWPIKQLFVAVDATDPEIGAKGDVVAVVFDQAGDVKCSTSIDGGGNWSTSTVATGASYPAAYVAENKIYCAYVKDGNLFYTASSDNGATWGTPTQINDQPGTVVAQPGTIDIGAAGFVWTDNRNSGKKDIYYEYMEMEPPVQVPKLEITKISGGIGVSATIGNTGDAPATNVQWTIKVTGGILGRIDVNGNGTIASLAVGGEGSGKTKMILGLGTISVQVTATCDEGSTATLTKAGKQLLIFSSIPA